MFGRLLVALAVVLAGAPVTAAPDATPFAAQSPERYATAEAHPAVVAAATPSASTVTALDVVVPPVASSGGVVETPQLREAETTGGAVVANQVASAQRLVSKVVETAKFQTLGVTWPAGAQADNLDVKVRTRSGGVWSDWAPLTPSDDAPDAGTSEAARQPRAGTDPLWVGDADAVQLGFAATAAGGPDGLSLALIGSDASTPTPTAAGAAATGGAVVRNAAFVSTAPHATAPLATAASAPTIISRAEWGARGQACTPDVASKLVGAVVHHTAGSNAYTTVAAAEQQIRNDQAYHIDQLHWCDIGYNFIVDKWGNIYEGRANSLTQPVIGVHAGGFNTGTVGVAMLGTYDATPSAATLASVGQIIGFRLAAYNVNPQGSMSYYTGVGENSRYQNQSVVLPRVFGHRDVAYTACPGNGGYGALGTIRTIAADYVDAQAYAAAQSVVKALYQDLLGRGPDPTGLAGWSALLFSGTSQSELVGSLTSSDEYLTSRITKAYREVLGREPEPGGAQAWLVAIQRGDATVDDVQRTFYDSDEYMKIAGGTPDGYVRRLFTTMLGRGASDADVAAWVGVFQTQGRGAAADGIWFSVEAARVRAGAYYQTFLGRGPDPTGLAGWASVLLAQGEGAVRTGIAGSQEYREKAIIRYP